VFRLLLFLFIVTPIAEFSLLFYLSDSIGLLPTVGLVLVTGVAGAALAKAQGYRTWQSIREQLSQGKMPSSELLDALMIFLAGALLVTPGVLTDLFGFSLLVPPCRVFYKRLARRYFSVNFQVQGMNTPSGGFPQRPASTQIIDSYVVEEDGDREAVVESTKESP
jgi:UPF0716 protein FxsA